MSEAKLRAATLEALAEVLLPGDALFPSGAVVGVQAKLAERVPPLAGEKALDRAIDGLPGLVEAAQGAARCQLVEKFEAAEPDLFATVRSVAFLAYYESPFVQEVIRGLGHAYNATPLPKGYGIRRFDRAKDQPRHGRGSYVPTDQVRRVDLAGLDIEELRHGR